MFKKFFSDFKAFAFKGNVMDMAIGVVIGGAFGKIVSSVVADVIMPAVGILLGGVNFSELKLVLKPEYVNEAGETIAASTLNYGSFIQSFVDFIIIALAIFIFMSAIGKLMKKKEEPAPEPEAPAPSEEVTLLTEIRDLLKSQK
ncbi:MAG: large-conductance mechanosensitive channel protein MscL [Muribaculaceae bacterium]|nr:large-conductance mechanosensitive channel protein MscL [Muribaculaceae bacterium]